MKEKTCKICHKVFKTYKKNQRFCSSKCFGCSDSVGIFREGCKVNVGRKRPDVVERNKKNVGKIPWNKGKRGVFSKEVLKKMSEKHKGKIVSEETRRKLSIIHKGRKMSEEAKIKVGKANSIIHRGKDFSKNLGKYAIPKVCSGENSPNWKGGITKIVDQIRHLLEYKLWREKVLKQNNYRCVQCNIKQGWNKQLKRRIALNIDHIKAFSTIFHENKIKTIGDALFCQAFWDINNGRSLCVDCHRKTDTWGVNIRI